MQIEHTGVIPSNHRCLVVAWNESLTSTDVIVTRYVDARRQTGAGTCFHETSLPSPPIIATDSLMLARNQLCSTCHDDQYDLRVNSNIAICPLPQLEADDMATEVLNGSRLSVSLKVCPKLSDSNRGRFFQAENER